RLLIRDRFRGFWLGLRVFRQDDARRRRGSLACLGGGSRRLGLHLFPHCHHSGSISGLSPHSAVCAPSADSGSALAGAASASSAVAPSSAVTPANVSTLSASSLTASSTKIGASGPSCSRRVKRKRVISSRAKNVTISSPRVRDVSNRSSNNT